MKKLFVALVLFSGHVYGSDAPAWRVSLPGTWTAATRGEVTTYRNAAGTQMLSAASYALLTAVRDEAERRALLLQSIALRRAAETEISSEVAMTPVRIRHVGDRLLMRFAGEDRVSGRRFVDVTIAAGAWVQHFHYEAIGLSAAAFEANVERMLRDVAGR